MKPASLPSRQGLSMALLCAGLAVGLALLAHTPLTAGRNACCASSRTCRS